MDSYMEMLGAAQQPIQQTAPQPQGFAGVTQPMDPVVQQMAVPATTPAEVQERAGLWQQVAQRFQTDPNLRQALMMMGAHLAQPNQPGQTTKGHLAQSLAFGNQVYNAGEYTKYEQQRQAAEDARKSAESQAQIALQGAQAEGARASAASTKAGTPGVAARAQLDVNTLDAKTQAAQADASKAVTEAAASKLALDTAKSVEEVNKIVRENTARAERIKAAIPDPVLQKAALAEVEAAALKADEAKARIAASKAAAGASAASAAHANAQTARENITNDMFKKLSDNEKLDFIKGTGKYSASQSAMRVQADLWGSLYDKLPADDTHKKGVTREQFQVSKLQEAKVKDAMELYIKGVQAGMTAQELDDMGLGDLARQAAGARKTPSGNTPAGANTGKTIKYGDLK